MKKILKIILIILGVLVSIILLDTIQARLFKHSPIISWKEKLDGDSYIDKGILINTYYCVKEKDIVNVSWHFKTSKFTCPFSEITLEEINDKIINFMSNNQDNNYAYNYIDLERQVIVVGLVLDNQNNQEEFITKVFSSCCGSQYINYIKENNLIEFKESKDVFEAKIIVAEKDYMTVEILKDSKIFKKDDKVTMKIARPTNGTNDFYVIGNKVSITFNGNVEESNPAQINAIQIELVK